MVYFDATVMSSV